VSARSNTLPSHHNSGDADIGKEMLRPSRAGGASVPASRRDQCLRVRRFSHAL